jgi:hypothetical protein
VLRLVLGGGMVCFEIQTICVDRFGLDGYLRQAEIRVTDATVVPWVFDRAMETLRPV